MFLFYVQQSFAVFTFTSSLHSNVTYCYAIKQNESFVNPGHNILFTFKQSTVSA